MFVLDTLSLTKVAYHIINLIILFVFFRFLLYNPVTNFLKKREDQISGQLDHASMMEQKAKANQGKYEELLAEADEELRKKAEQARINTEKEAREIIEQAKLEAREIIKQARGDQVFALQRAREQIKHEAVSLALDIAGKVLQKEMNEEDHRNLIDNYLEKVG